MAEQKKDSVLLVNVSQNKFNDTEIKALESFFKANGKRYGVEIINLDEPIPSDSTLNFKIVHFAT